MTENSPNNDQFPTDAMTLVLALLLSIPLAQTRPQGRPMTAPTTHAPDPATGAETAERIHDHINQLNTMIGRCDTKASLLLALTGTSLAGIISVAANTQPPGLALAVGAAGAALLLAAVQILLTVVRPNTDGPGWPRWPELDDPQLAAALTAERRLDEARTLARLARRKFAGVRRAVDCTRLGLLLLALAGVLTGL